MLILIVQLWLEGLGFNLDVAPFPSICVPNCKLEGICQSWLELIGIGQRLLESS